MQPTSMRLLSSEREWLDEEVKQLNERARAAGQRLGRPKHKFGRADVLRDLRERALSDQEVDVVLETLEAAIAGKRPKVDRRVRRVRKKLLQRSQRETKGVKAAA